MPHLYNTTGILLLITYFQRDLYCTSEVLTEALNQPSTFCRISGKGIPHTMLGSSMYKQPEGMTQ